MREKIMIGGGVVSLLGVLQIPELRQFASNFLKQNDAGRNVDNELTEICDWLFKRGVDDSCKLPPSMASSPDSIFPANDNNTYGLEALHDTSSIIVALIVAAGAFALAVAGKTVVRA